MENSQEQDLADQIFSTRNFVRTLSYREFITSLSLALLLMAFFKLLDYYSDEDWIASNDSFIRWASFFIILPLNHVFYKVEHGRQNNFIGRNLHDYIFLLLFLMLYKLQLYLDGMSFSFGMEGIGGVIVFLLVFIIVVILLELIVALVKRVLRFFRWQIL